MEYIERVALGKGLEGVGAQERDTTKRRRGCGHTMDSGFGSKRDVVEKVRSRNEAGAMLGGQRRARQNGVNALGQKLARWGCGQPVRLRNRSKAPKEDLGKRMSIPESAGMAGLISLRVNGTQ